jgi:hypothetical protein
MRRWPPLAPADPTSGRPTALSESAPRGQRVVPYYNPAGQLMRRTPHSRATEKANASQSAVDKAEDGEGAYSPRRAVMATATTFAVTDAT